MAPAVLISGSTGKTKTVVLSQYNIVNNLVDAAAFGDYQPEDQTPGILPLFRIFGQVLLSGSLILDYAILFPETVSADSALRCVESFGVTRMNGDGILHITGRIKEIIIRNGVNLSARHIEEVLLSVPGVSAAAVVGIPHPQQGEVPAAMAVSDRTEAE